MLVRYCAPHVRVFGYPRLLGVRWNGWTISTVGGLCEACREREREWGPDPYGRVLIPLPVELGPRTLGRRASFVSIIGAIAVVVATAALLVANPSDLIPSGGKPELFSSGARLVALPQEEPDITTTETPAASRRDRSVAKVPHVVASRVAHRRVAAAPPPHHTPQHSITMTIRPPRPQRVAPPLVGVQSP